MYGKKVVIMKSLIYISIIVLGALYISCNQESVAETTKSVYTTPDNPPIGKDISCDISRIRDLYSKFNFIARSVVDKNKINPTDIHQLNEIVLNLKYFDIIYTQKFFNKEINKTTYALLLTDPSSNKIISDYIFLTRQLQNIEGRQFLNL